MKQITDTSAAEPWRKRLQTAMEGHLAQPDYRDPTFVCPDCHDTLFVPGSAGGYKKCHKGMCPAWKYVRDDLLRFGESKRRKRERFEV